MILHSLRRGKGTQRVSHTSFAPAHHLLLCRVCHAASGNLVFKRTSRNFNPMVATAGKVTVAEVEHIVPAGGSPASAVPLLQ